MDHMPHVGEWVTCPDGQGQITHLDPETEMATVRVGDTQRTYAITALSPGKPSSAWGL